VLSALDGRRQQLDHTALRLARPTDWLRRQAQTLALLGHRLGVALRQAGTMRAQQERQTALRLRRAVALQQRERVHGLAALAARLDALDPRRVLARGYAWLSDSQGLALTSATQVAAGQHIVATLSDGRLNATVLDVDRAAPRSSAADHQGGGRSRV